MLFLLILTLCYSVSSFHLEKTVNAGKDGNLKGLEDGFMKTNKNGKETVDYLERVNKNMELLKKNSLSGFSRTADVSSRTERGVRSVPMHRFCQKVDLDGSIRDYDMPASFDWSQQLSTSHNRNITEYHDLVARTLAFYTEIKYELKYGKSVNLAAKQLIDCAQEWEKDLSWTGYVTRLMTQGGFERESDYRSNSSDAQCRFDESKVVAGVGSCHQFNIEKENMLRSIVYNYGPLLVGLRKLEGDTLHRHDKPVRFYDDSCEGVVDKYTPYILMGYGTYKDVDLWSLLVPNLDQFVPQWFLRGATCRDIGIHTLMFDVEDYSTNFLSKPIRKYN